MRMRSTRPRKLPTPSKMARRNAAGADAGAGGAAGTRRSPFPVRPRRHRRWSRSLERRKASSSSKMAEPVTTIETAMRKVMPNDGAGGAAGAAVDAADDERATQNPASRDHAQQLIR